MILREDWNHFTCWYLIHETSMELSWNSHETLMVVPMELDSVELDSMGLPWDCHEILPALTYGIVMGKQEKVIKVSRHSRWAFMVVPSKLLH